MNRYEYFWHIIKIIVCGETDHEINQSLKFNTIFGQILSGDNSNICFFAIFLVLYIIYIYIYNYGTFIHNYNYF